MRSTVLRLFTILLGICSCVVAQDYSVCRPVITQGLREYNISTSSSSSLDVIYDRYCDASGEFKSTGASAGLDLIVGELPIGFKGSYSTSDQAFHNFCRNYYSQRQANANSFSYQEKIVTKAYDAFNECVRFITLGVSIQHNPISLEQASIFLWAGVGKPIQVRGVFTSSNVTCTGQDPNSHTTTAITYGPNSRVSTNDNLGLSCKRTSRPGAAGVSVFDEGTIQVVTNYGSYDVFWPKDDKLPDNVASELDKRVQTLETGLQSASNKLAATNARISGIKLTSTGITQLPDFACGQETKADNDPLLFMVGSRDGTSCGVRNIDYVRHLDLSIPSPPQ